MHFDQIRDEFAKLESEIADGPIVPNVTPQEIRAHLGSRYDFKRTMALDEVIADVEQMLRKWQVQVTHPRYFGLYNPSVMPASVVCRYACGHVQPATGQLAHFARGKRD